MVHKLERTTTSKKLHGPSSYPVTLRIDLIILLFENITIPIGITYCIELRSEQKSHVTSSQPPPTYERIYHLALAACTQMNFHLVHIPPYTCYTSFLPMHTHTKCEYVVSFCKCYEVNDVGLLTSTVSMTDVRSCENIGHALGISAGF